MHPRRCRRQGKILHTPFIGTDANGLLTGEAVEIHISSLGKGRVVSKRPSQGQKLLRIVQRISGDGIQAMGQPRRPQLQVKNRAETALPGIPARKAPADECGTDFPRSASR